jgi:hypothetical protein
MKCDLIITHITYNIDTSVVAIVGRVIPGSGRADFVPGQPLTLTDEAEDSGDVAHRVAEQLPPLPKAEQSAEQSPDPRDNKNRW